ncbi:APH(3')-I family aminoglycoside O-phosphotransferase [Sphingomonas glacialis]|uniref:Aminoglycoside 3'-phosphotransferase n=1 Tax=Sphingomonas glacialis TaxID=658225 RepID=A0A502FJV1_9SPHN|nr:APH(3')-I family aminoglycoside O-phosphotransferase [Sphingomonas glacialis]TPG49681.1 APH(3')-I family aminoglycoside O-phosphotransferase [Sphingomonas glacialis]
MREEDCAAVCVPASLSAEVAGYTWSRDYVGQSGGAVYRLHSKAGAPDLFLKHGSDNVADDITGEMLRLRWLARHLPVPAVIRFVADPDEAWLLMTAVPGETAYQALEERPDCRIATIDALATFLRRLHTIPVSDCPFISDLPHRLARARARIDAGLVEEDDFDAAREGWTAEQVWGALQQLLPLPSDSVVTHGDFSLDNILMRDGAVVGCIDVGRVGVADRYQDIAIAWNSLGEFDAALQERFLAHYGIAEVDRAKLQVHLLLDELF